MMRKRMGLFVSLLVLVAMILAACQPVATTPGAEVPTALPEAGEETPGAVVPPEETPAEVETPEAEVTPEETPVEGVTPEETPAETPEAEMTPEETPAETPEAEETPAETPEAGVTPEATPAEGEAVATLEPPTPEDVLAIVGDEDISGQTVSFLAQWGGSEQESFLAMVAPWEEATGATVEYEGTRDTTAVLTTRIQAGNPPDISGIPGPGQLIEFGRAGNLVDLSTFIDTDEFTQQYGESWVELGSVDGTHYGVFMKVSVKSLVWYRPDVFAERGWTMPTTWDELIALSDEIVAAGETPWCIGLESAATSGWPGTDWIEDIMLRTAAPETYDQWWMHEIPWTDESVRNAWEMFGTIAANEDYVQGGTTGELATNFGESPFPMFQDPPGCYMHRQASFITDFIQQQFPDLQAGTDYTFFVLPPVDEQFGAPILSAGDLLAMFNDTPAARSLMTWLASAEAQQIWANRGGFLAANTEVAPEVYPDPMFQEMAQLLQEAETVRFDASDLMPAAVQEAFLGGILEFVPNPDGLDSILQNIESVAEGAYQEQAAQ
jgi:alpha-glucoside transport system substrate-binding protein